MCGLWQETGCQIVFKSWLALFVCEIRVHVVTLVNCVVLCLKHLAIGRGMTINKHLLMDVCRIDGLDKCFGIQRGKR